MRLPAAMLHWTQQPGIDPREPRQSSCAHQIREYNQRIETLAEERYSQTMLLKQVKGVGTADGETLIQRKMHCVQGTGPLRFAAVETLPQRR